MAFDSKYRPKTLRGVLGQEAVIKSLNSLLNDDDPPHSYLFSGPSGVGKTTLARVVASEFNAKILEVDAATYSKVEDVRTLTERMIYKPIGSENRLMIIDECQALSKQAWQAFLKTIEEPPTHAFFAFCTTELGKVPNTVVTRCAHFKLNALRHDDLTDLLIHVAGEEEIDLNDEELSIIAREAHGSARQALVYLEMCRECENKNEIRTTLASADESLDAIELARMLAKGERIDEMLKLAMRLEEQGVDAESLRIVVMRYMTKVAYNSSGDKLSSAAAVLDVFSTPCNRSEGFAPIVLAICRLKM